MNTAQEEKLSRSQKIKKRLKEVWVLSEPYRLGFGLGALAVSATLVLVLTGQKSEKLNYKSQPAPEVMAVPKESGTNDSLQTLGATASAQPNDEGSQPQSNNNSPSLRSVRPGAISPLKPASGKVNINTASAVGLDALPQIGPVTAKAIIDYRNAHGPFKSINDLDNVKGVGPKTIEKIRNLVSVE